MIFLDSSNLYPSLKEIGRSLYHLDFSKLASQLLVANRTLVRFLYYAAPVDRLVVPATLGEHGTKEGLQLYG